MRVQSTIEVPRFRAGGRPRAPIVRVYLGDDEIVVDNFAGGGGASSGIARAIGRDPDVAINHDPEAIAMHAANHPRTRHYIENVWDVDPVEVAGGKKVALVWLSPTCTFFSKARGGPLSAEAIKVRALAWIGVRWAAAVMPRILCLENVSEFERWGPLHREHTGGCKGVACKDGCRFGKRAKNRGKGPIKRHCKGCHGVACAKHCRIHRPIKAREGETFRAFVDKLRRLGYVVEWRHLSACDYGAPTTRRRLFMVARRDGLPIVWPEPTHGPGRANPYRPAAEIIDWDLPCPSIFDRDRPLADKTLARIARGIQKFVIDNPRPFIVPVSYGDKGGTDVRVNDITEPLRTVCGHRGGHSLVTPVVIKAKTYGGGGNDARPATAPLSTILRSKRGEHAVVTPTLVRVAWGEVDSTGKKRGSSTAQLGTDPLPTVTGSNDFAIAVPRLVPKNGNKCAALLIKHNGGNNDIAGSAGQPVTRPVDTLATHNTKSVAVAHLVRYNGERRAGEARGAQCELPLPTLDTSNRFGLVSSHLVKLRGTSDAHIESSAISIEDPVPTISSGARSGSGGAGGHIAQVAAFLVRYNGQSTGQNADTPIGTLDTTDRYGLVTLTIDGEEYVVVDIGMRMLTPRELYRAHDFDEDYEIAPTWNGKPLSKTAQIRMVGNSVPPIMAEVIAAAQLAAGRDLGPAQRMAA